MKAYCHLKPVVCPETDLQAKVIKRNNHLKLIQIPDHIYHSFCIHSKSVEKVRVSFKLFEVTIVCYLIFNNSIL